MEIGRSLSLVVDALDSLVDIDGLVRKGNVLHLESAKLADPNAGKQRNQNTRRFSVQVHVDAPEGANLNTPKRILHFFEKVVAVVLKFSK